MFFERIYPKILNIPDFHKELKLGINGKILKHLWFEGLNDNSTCLQSKSLDNFANLCDVRYDENGDKPTQMCSKCRTRKICLKVNPPETKSAKGKAKRINFSIFYRFWPSIVRLISRNCKHFPDSYFEASKRIAMTRKKGPKSGDDQMDIDDDIRGYGGGFSKIIENRGFRRFFKKCGFSRFFLKNLGF